MDRKLFLNLSVAALLAACSHGQAPPPAAPGAESATVDRRAPIYPLVSRRSGEQGLVKLQVLVNDKGKPLKVYLLKSSGHAGLDADAQDEVRKWRFLPAQKQGKPIEEWVLVPIRYTTSH